MTPSQDEFDKTLKEIAQSSEYSILRLKNYISNFIVRIREIISDWLVERSTDIGWNMSPVISDKMSSLFIFIGFGLIIAVIILVIIIITRGTEKERKVKEILGKKIDEDTTPQTLKSKAVEFKQRGDLRQAIRHDFIALLYLMQGKSILHLNKTKTNQEIYQHLKENNFSELDSFQNLIDIFNSTWYGHKSCSNKLYNRWTENINLVWNEVLDL